MVGMPMVMRYERHQADGAYPSLIDSFRLNHTRNGTFPVDSLAQQQYEQMLALKEAQIDVSNQLTEEQIIEQVLGTRRGHNRGRGQVLYSVTGPDATKEIECVAAISNWLSGLQKFLPSQVNADLAKLGLAGHSRGGKVAFALALNKLHTELNLKFSALIGIDPVDGMDMGKQTQPKVLTYVPHSFNLEMPVMVIGSGLGEIRKNPLFPACAPKGVNHEDFYNECCNPACYFVVKDYGHLDMLDDETTGIRGKFTHCLCKNGKSREPMRRFVGGVVVAFLKAYLEGDFGYLMAIKDEGIAPVVLQKVDFLL